MGVLAPEPTAAPPRVRPHLEASDDLRTLAARLRRRLLDLAPEAARAHPVTPARACAIARAWAASLELRPNRALLRGFTAADFTAWGPAHVDPAHGRARARLFAVDALGRALTLVDMSGGAASSEGYVSPPADDLLARLDEAGPLPLWLAREQVRVLPVTAAQLPAAEALIADLRGLGLRVAPPRHDAPLAGRIARAARDRVPCVVVLGARESAAGTVSVREKNTVHEEPRAGFLQRVASAAEAPHFRGSRRGQPSRRNSHSTA